MIVDPLRDRPVQCPPRLHQIIQQPIGELIATNSDLDLQFKLNNTVGHESKDSV